MIVTDRAVQLVETFRSGDHRQGVQIRRLRGPGNGDVGLDRPDPCLQCPISANRSCTRRLCRGTDVAARRCGNRFDE